MPSTANAARSCALFIPTFYHSISTRRRSASPPRGARHRVQPPGTREHQITAPNSRRSPETRRPDRNWSHDQQSNPFCFAFCVSLLRARGSRLLGREPERIHFEGDEDNGFIRTRCQCRVQRRSAMDRADVRYRSRRSLTATRDDIAGRRQISPAVSFRSTGEITAGGGGIARRHRRTFRVGPLAHWVSPFPAAPPGCEHLMVGGVSCRRSFQNIR